MGVPKTLVYSSLMWFTEMHEQNIRKMVSSKTRGQCPFHSSGYLAHEIDLVDMIILDLEPP